VQLLYTPIKQYTHTVEAVIAYAGVAGRISPVPTRPFDPETPLGQSNPLSTVPTLLTDEHEPLYGGPVIYEYLDSLHDRLPLYPKAGAARWKVLRQAWMADGMFDTTVRLIVESWEPRDRDQLERDAEGFGALTIAQLRAVGALSFLDLKMQTLGAAVDGLNPDYAWRDGRPKLADWYGRAAANPIFSFNLVHLP
jgi:glutathione S-transferase